MQVLVVGPTTVTEVSASCVLAGRHVPGHFGLGTVGDHLNLTFVDQEDASTLAVDRDTFLTALDDVRTDHANTPRRGIRRRRSPMRTVVSTSAGPLGIVASHHGVTLQAPFQVIGRSRWRTVRGPSHWTCTSRALDEALAWSAAKDAERNAWDSASGAPLADRRSA